MPVGEETDRRWEQGEDPSMIDSDFDLAAIGLRRLIRECKLSQSPITKAIKGEPIRRRTLAIIRQVAAKITD